MVFLKRVDVSRMNEVWETVMWAFPSQKWLSSPPSRVAPVAQGEETASQSRRENRKSAWRRRWQPPPVFLPGEAHGQRTLAGYSPRGRKESDAVRFSSVAQSCLTLWDPMDCSTPGLPVHHQLPECTQTHVHWVGDAIQPSHPLSSPSPPALNLSQHQGLFQWVSSLYQVAKVLEFQLQHQSLQWTPKTDLL